MKEFKPKRAKREFIQDISASPDKIFPLLCPVREQDWIDGWSYDMIYTESGFAETNCVFTTSYAHGTGDTWMVTRRDPESHAIEFVVMKTGSHVMKLDVSVREIGDNKSQLRWAITFTALTEQGNKFIHNDLDAVYPVMFTNLCTALEHYCTTGKMLKGHSAPQPA